ncbi:hypothetical protein LZ554_006614 [Drepanopeziza brunnea f. sp. 'monogermtubi']|nr:hypothetical protein LZ554_006614 [Drepanopeziza brunnea f. sp. 'monogermtubi']
MMFKNAIVAAALLASSTVVAAPPALAKRANTVNMCLDPYYVGCKETPFEFDKCTNLEKPYIDSVSSLNTNGHTCVFFFYPGCDSGYFEKKGEIPWIMYDGTNVHFEDTISSFLCHTPK